MKTYHKLVRDQIPEIIRKTGSIPTTHVADDVEYWEKLKEKLQEEVQELLDGTNTEEELADILEVIHAICEVKGIDAIKLRQTQEEKASTRGGFKKRIILEKVDEGGIYPER